MDFKVALINPPLVYRAGDFHGKRAMVTFVHSQPYQSTHPDSLFELKANTAIYLEVALSGADKIFGRVFDALSNDPLDSVRVSIRNNISYSDNTGWFELSIPAELQVQFQKVAFSKNGYQFKEMDSVRVDVQKELTVVLKKR